MPRNLCDIGFGFQCRHHHVQVFYVAQVHVDDKSVKIRFAFRKPQIGYVGFLLANQGANATQNALVVRYGNIQRNGIDGRMTARMPLQINPAVWLFFKLFQRGAINRMDQQALAAIRDADDTFSGQRLTAGGAAEGLIVGHADDGAGGFDLVSAALDQFGIEGFDHLASGEFGRAQSREKFRLIWHPQHFGSGAQGFVCGFFANVFKGCTGKFLAQPDKTTAIFFAQRFANRGLGATGGDNVDPGCLRALAFGSDDFDRLAVFQPRPQRHADAVDLGRHAGIADAGVDRIGIIKRRGAARQLHHITLGGEAEHLIGIHL